MAPPPARDFAWLRNHALALALASDSIGAKAPGPLLGRSGSGLAPSDSSPLPLGAKLRGFLT
eukprot:5235524-Pyramimonas_sp.AAC.1